MRQNKSFSASEHRKRLTRLVKYFVKGVSRAPSLTGVAASEITLEALTPNVSIVHFATHGIFIENDPLDRQSYWHHLQARNKGPGGGWFLTVGESFGLIYGRTISVV